MHAYGFSNNLGAWRSGQFRSGCALVAPQTVEEEEEEKPEDVVIAGKGHLAHNCWQGKGKGKGKGQQWGWQGKGVNEVDYSYGEAEAVAEVKIGGVWMIAEIGKKKKLANR